MFRNITILIGCILWALPVWAGQQKPVQTIEEAYNLMLETVADYPTNLRSLSVHLPSTTPPTKVRVENLSDLFGRSNKDFWRGRVTISTSGFGRIMKLKRNFLSCTRIGHSTLAHLRQTFQTNENGAGLKGDEGEKYLIAKIFENAPDTAVAMQMCNLSVTLPLYDEGEAIYQNLLTMIGDSFIAENGATGVGNVNGTTFYNFKGTGNLKRSGAIVIGMQVNITTFSRGFGISFFTASYLLPSNS